MSCLSSVGAVAKGRYDTGGQCVSTIPPTLAKVLQNCAFLALLENENGHVHVAGAAKALKLEQTPPWAKIARDDFAGPVCLRPPALPSTNQFYNQHKPQPRTAITRKRPSCSS